MLVHRVFVHVLVMRVQPARLEVVVGQRPHVLALKRLVRWGLRERPRSSLFVDDSHLGLPSLRRVISASGVAPFPVVLLQLLLATAARADGFPLAHAPLGSNGERDEKGEEADDEDDDADVDGCPFALGFLVVDLNDEGQGVGHHLVRLALLPANRHHLVR